MDDGDEQFSKISQLLTEEEQLLDRHNVARTKLFNRVDDLDCAVNFCINTFKQIRRQACSNKTNKRKCEQIYCIADDAIKSIILLLQQK